jgi:hypothetical protein
MSSRDGKVYMSMYPRPPQTRIRAKPILRALEGIKNKLQLLSERPATAEGVEKEGTWPLCAILQMTSEMP